MGDISDLVEKAAEAGSEASRTLPAARFWAVYGLLAFIGVFLIVGAAVGGYIYLTQVLHSEKLQAEKLEEARQELKQARQQLTQAGQEAQELRSALGRTSLALAELKTNSKAHEMRLTELQQRVDGQVREIADLKPRVALVEKDAKRLWANLMQSVVALGATPLANSYAAMPRRPTFPAEIEKQYPEVSEGTKQPQQPDCLFKVNGFGIICRPPPGPQQ